MSSWAFFKNNLFIYLLVFNCFTSPLNMHLQKAMEQEEGDEEEEKESKPDPLHQLILHFSRTALTEKRLEASTGMKCTNVIST